MPAGVGSVSRVETASVDEKTTIDILVVGDLMIDRTWYCSIKGASQEAPVLCMHVEGVNDSLGAAGNVVINADAIARHRGKQLSVVFGGPKHYLDSEMNRADDLFPPHLFDQAFPGGRMCVKNRIVWCEEPQQQVIRFDDDTVFQMRKTEEQVFSTYLRCFSANVGIVCDHSYGAITRMVLEAMRDACKTVIVDPKGCDPTKYAGLTDIIIPNVKELGNLTNGDSDPSRLAETTGARVVQKLGSRGVAVGSHIYMPYRPGGSALDPTGAGDTFIATMGYCLAEGASLEEAVKIANRMAGLSVLVNGCFVPKQGQTNDAFTPGIIQRKEDYVKEDRSKG